MDEKHLLFRVVSAAIRAERNAWPPRTATRHYDEQGRRR